MEAHERGTAHKLENKNVCYYSPQEKAGGPSITWIIEYIGSFFLQKFLGAGKTRGHTICSNKGN